MRAERFPLPGLELEIDAQAGLVHQVVSAVGLSGGGHSSRLLEQLAPDRMLVEFTTTLLGRPLRTVEEVTVAPPTGVHYRLVSGPLPEVEEDFLILGDRPCTLRYSGWFKPNKGLRGWFDRLVVPHLYRSAVLASMRQVKGFAETRQRKSRLFSG